jgi:hypothetical protein
VQMRLQILLLVEHQALIKKVAVQLLVLLDH